MSSAADTTPISPTRFAAALKDLSIGMLHLKNLEIRNSIAHLQYSNDQLKPFAEGSATAVSDNGNPANVGTAATAADSQATAGGPDQDCIDAIRENEQVIDRMAERIALIRAEVEERGVSWTEFQSKDEVEAQREDDSVANVNGHGNTHVNGTTGATSDASPHSAWNDGTFQTGTIRNGEVRLDRQAGQSESGGSLSDEQLRQALEERMRNLGNDDDDESGDGGMHL